MEVRSVNLKGGAKRTILIALFVALIGLMLLIGKWAFGHSVAVNATETEVAALGVDLAPGDPYAHFELAQLLERTLLPGDQERALRELESAAALSPNNYPFWLALGRAREQSGDSAAGEQALRRAQELAPNYSRVQWALGNALLRQARNDEAFAEIRKAAAAEAMFAAPAAATAWQILDGDVEQIHRAIGDSPPINVSLAVLLANDKRYEQALEFWRRVPASELNDGLKEAAQGLFSKLAEGGLYRSAIEIAAQTGLYPNEQISVGMLSNGDFESPLRPQNATIFSWTIADGTFPRVGQNRDQKRSGNYSLLMSFDKGGKGFRQVSQRAGVEPSQNYEVRFFYRSELMASARARCDVYSAAGGLIAATTLLTQKQEWIEGRVPFTVPQGVEGIEVRINIEGCPETGCGAEGRIWLDDFSLQKV